MADNVYSRHEKARGQFQGRGDGAAARSARSPISVYTSDPGNTPGKGFETVRVALRSGRQSDVRHEDGAEVLAINPSRALMQRDLSTTTIAVAR